MTAVTIRRARASDAEGVARQMGDPEVFGGLLQLPFPSVENWRTRITEMEAPNRHDLFLVADSGDAIVGSAGLHPVATAVRRRHASMLGISVAREWRRRGVASQLMTALLDAADRWLGCLRVELTVYADNDAAIALYRKFGFEHEGTHRAYALRDGRYVDTHSMARLHPNPPRIDT